jgi:hypothetical protein
MSSPSRDRDRRRRAAGTGVGLRIRDDVRSIGRRLPSAIRAPRCQIQMVAGSQGNRQQYSKKPAKLLAGFLLRLVLRGLAINIICSSGDLRRKRFAKRRTASWPSSFPSKSKSFNNFLDRRTWLPLALESANADNSKDSSFESRCRGTPSSRLHKSFAVAFYLGFSDSPRAPSIPPTTP